MKTCKECGADKPDNFFEKYRSVCCACRMRKRNNKTAKIEPVMQSHNPFEWRTYKPLEFGSGTR